MQERFLDRQLIYGGRFQQFLRELLTNSGVFWMFDMVRQSSLRGIATYAASLPHWVLFGSGIVQAWIISRNSQQRWWQHFIAPLLYTVIDVLLEGPTAFFSEPYHILYWIWAIAMAAAYLFQNYALSFATILKSLLLVLLLPVSYMLAEWETVSLTPLDYWLNSPSHLFILLGTIVLGLLLGITAIMRERFERLLYKLAGHFEQIASWSFDTGLIQSAYNNDSAFALQRQERTLLFMDIRGFTPWSESHQPREVVDMVNQFYRTVEPLIKMHNGFKIQMTGDEIMTRFYSADEALAAAQALQSSVAKVLALFGLSAGVGLHSGEVIEGLVGGEQTRQYGIFGDTVNIAARLQGQAKSGEIIISQVTWEKLTHIPVNSRPERRELMLKGKTEPMSVMVLSLSASQDLPIGSMAASP